MIIRQAEAPLEVATAELAARHGPYTALRLSQLGGLQQFGAYVETLEPGAESAERHWHEREDEFLYVLAGEATVIEDDGEHLLQPGDCACWPAGVPNAHHVVNRSAAPCSYLIVGTRMAHDVCHYPDSGRTLYTEGESWRLEDGEGALVKSGLV